MQGISTYQVKRSDITVTCVDARELHTLLDVKMKFSTWIKHHIKTKKLVDGYDYFSQAITTDPIPFVGTNPYAESYNKECKRTDYQLTLRAAMCIAESTHRPPTSKVVALLKTYL